MKTLIKKIVYLFGIDIIRKRKLDWNCWPVQKAKNVVFFDIDADFHQSYDFAQIKTQMSYSDNAYRRQRHYTLMQLFKNAMYLNGSVVECGTFRGLSAYQIAQIMRKYNIQKKFHIFDSFEGLSEIAAEDNRRDQKANEKLQNEFAYSEDSVKKNLSEFNFIQYYKGWIPDRFKDVTDPLFSFVHIDVDLYQPIKDSIAFFYNKMVPGGIMVFDDYGYTAQFPGAKRAIDEALKKIKPSFFLALPSGQAFLIK